MCNEVYQLYLDDKDSHIRYQMFRWLLVFAGKIGGSDKVITAVVDLMQLPEKDDIESVAFKYFLENRDHLFFGYGELWQAIGRCYCDDYGKTLPVSCLIQ